MDGVNRNRVRWGAIAWLLTLQFFVVEAVAQSRFVGAYSRTDDVISTLGTADSAARQLMNASFVVQGALIIAGALLLRPLLQRSAGQVAPVLLGLAGIGVLIVGAFPSDRSSGVHATGAVLYLAGGGLGLIALAYALRPRSEALGTTLALLGLIGTAATVFFVTGVTRFLGEGGTERAAAYVLPLGLALTGAVLWRLGAGNGTDGAARREERELARAQRAERERERDEALEAAAGRSATSRQSEVLPDTDEQDTDEQDTDDPWAAPPRRRAD
jgi:hypothetical membrane protein